MERADYEADICRRLPEAKPVPFRVVSIGEWAPERNQCHPNVDTWVKAHPGTVAVRGWAIYLDHGVLGIQLTAHSVVRGPDHELFDITPLADERMRPFMRFVCHTGDADSFAMERKRGIFITCPCSGEVAR